MSLLDAAGWVIAAVAAVYALVAVRRRRLGVALGILFGLSWLSGITFSVAGAGVRLEQPVAVLLAGALLASERAAAAEVVRRGRWPIALAAVYLTANVASALLSAPDVAQSLKICLWLGLSLLAGLVAATLVVASDGRGTHREVVRWVVGMGCLQAVVAAVQVAAELLVQSDWGVLRSDVAIGKALGLAWEPNLLAIELAASMMFVLDPGSARDLSRTVRIAACATIAAGIALSLSRGGIVALVAASAVMVVIRLWRTPRRLDRSIIGLAGASALALAIAGGGYLGISWLAAQGVGLRPGEVAAAPAGPEQTLKPVGPGQSGTAARTPTPASSDGGSPQPGEGTAGPSPSTTSAWPAPSIRVLGAGDTVELRLRNLQVAVVDGVASPWVGLGPDTFGQRYIEPSCSCPAHVPNQLAATFYESGLIGLGALVLLLGWVLVQAARRRLDAYLAALVALLVGYQFTDALRFGVTWILVGTIVGLVVVTGGRIGIGPAPPDRPGP